MLGGKEEAAYKRKLGTINSEIQFARAWLTRRHAAAAVQHVQSLFILFTFFFLLFIFILAGLAFTHMLLELVVRKPSGKVADIFANFIFSNIILCNISLCSSFWLCTPSIIHSLPFTSPSFYYLALTYARKEFTSWIKSSYNLSFLYITH